MCYNEHGDSMIVNSKEMLEKAKQGKYAIAHFNINNLEWTRFILEECNMNNAPVILGVSEGAIKYMGGYKVVANLVKNLDEELHIKVPVSIHLDHGSSIDSCIKAINAGFTSVMIDASRYPLEVNVEMTKKVVEYAKKYNVTVEAEIGCIGGSEDNITSEIKTTSVEDALALASSTEIDALAPALGSVHGIYKGEPKLDFDKMKQIQEATNLPLVLHGGSGIDDEKIKHAIKCGICKLNINTDLQIVWSKAVRGFLEVNKEVYDPRKIIKSGEEAMRNMIKEKITLLGSIYKQ